MLITFLRMNNRDHTKMSCVFLNGIISFLMHVDLRDRFNLNFIKLIIWK